jgi:hypothetical protein
MIKKTLINYLIIKKYLYLYKYILILNNSNIFLNKEKMDVILINLKKIKIFKKLFVVYTNSLYFFFKFLLECINFGLFFDIKEIFLFGKKINIYKYIIFIKELFNIYKKKYNIINNIIIDYFILSYLYKYYIKINIYNLLKLIKQKNDNI